MYSKLHLKSFDNLSILIALWLLECLYMYTEIKMCVMKGGVVLYMYMES